MHDSVHNELRHRGESLVEYPDASLWITLGGSDGVSALIKDLYHRIGITVPSTTCSRRRGSATWPR
jgi:hypothetical protein